MTSTICPTTSGAPGCARATRPRPTVPGKVWTKCPRISPTTSKDCEYHTPYYSLLTFRFDKLIKTISHVSHTVSAIHQHHPRMQRVMTDYLWRALLSSDRALTSLPLRKFSTELVFYFNITTSRINHAHSFSTPFFNCSCGWTRCQKNKSYVGSITCIFLLSFS